MDAPPSLVGASKSTVMEVRFFRIPVRVGAPGAIAGVEAVTKLEGLPVPLAFTARIFTWYVLVLARPVILIEFAVDGLRVKAQVDPPSSESW